MNTSSTIPTNTTVICDVMHQRLLSQKTVSVNGNAIISTAQYKTNNSSCYFDGSGDYLSIADSDDFYFGTGDFTIRGYFYFTSLPTSNNAIALLGQAPDGNNWTNLGIYNTAGTLSIRFSSGSGGSTLMSLDRNVTLSTNTWYHIELIRSGNDFMLFLNGAKQGATYTISVSLPNWSVPFTIGYVNTGTAMSGYIDELEISKGIARHTSGFTPSITSINPDDYTALLLHMDGVNNSTTLTDDIYIILKSNVSSFTDLSDVNISIYPSLKIRWLISRNSIADSTPIINNFNITWEGAGFAASIMTSGYQKLPSGLIMQWGVSPSIYFAGGALTFPIAFPNSVFQVTANAEGGSQGGAVAICLGSFTNTSVTAYHNGNGSVNVRWIAIGY
jgi:hypothetical protein